MFLNSYQFKEGVKEQFEYYLDLNPFLANFKTYTNVPFDDNTYLAKSEPNSENIIFSQYYLYGDVGEPTASFKADIGYQRFNTKITIPIEINNHGIEGLNIFINNGIEIINPKTTPLLMNSSELLIIFDYDGSKQINNKLNNTIELFFNNFNINTKFLFNISIEITDIKSNVVDKIKNKIRKIF